MTAQGPTTTLRSRLVGATLWIILGTVSQHLLRLVSNLIVTRLLAPDMFGVMAVATTVPVIMALLSDIGLTPNIVRSPWGDDPVFLDTAWTVSIVRGLLMWTGAVCVAMGLYFASAAGMLDPQSTYANPVLPWVIGISSLTSVLMGFGSTKLATAVRHFNSRGLVRIDVLSALAGVTAMVLGAWLTRSIWALVASGLVGGLCHTLLSHVMLPGHRNRLHWDRQALERLLSFGKWLFLSSAISVFAMQGDRLMLAGFVEAHVLGMYSIALALVSVLDGGILQLFDKVFLPAFSEVARRSEEAVPGAFFRLRRRLDPVMVTAAGMLFAAGPTIVGLMYDPRYAAAGHMLSVLSLGLMVSRYSLAQQVYLALNRPQYQVTLNFVRFVSIYALVPIGYRLWGLEGALYAIALRELPVVPLIFWFNARHRLNNLRLELASLLFWPLGYAIGEMAQRAVHLVLHAVRGVGV